MNVYKAVSATKHNGPKAKLEAARSIKASPEELVELAGSDYGFVKAAVAANPNTPIKTLQHLLPKALAGTDDYEIAIGLLTNPNLAPTMFVQIERLIETIANGILPRDYYANELIKSLAGSLTAPTEAILPLADPATMPKHVRSRIANVATRVEILKALANDPSERIRKMAIKALSEINIEG